MANLSFVMAYNLLAYLLSLSVLFNVILSLAIYFISTFPCVSFLLNYYKIVSFFLPFFLSLSLPISTLFLFKRRQYVTEIILLDVCLFSTNLYFLNLLMTVCILDSLDKTPKVGDRLLLNPPTQGNINTEKK